MGIGTGIGTGIGMGIGIGIEIGIGIRAGLALFGSFLEFSCPPRTIVRGLPLGHR